MKEPQASTSSSLSSASNNISKKDQLDPSSVLNINVGVLGHVDSGKTSLVKALSTLLSTAALDKSKQSRERGMTLDLGFSCFFLESLPDHLRAKFPTKKRLQITLVDCPGHASLIRTIIGGAQIIDVVLLVVDAVKGWQAQTTECLVLAELCSPHLVVALNKIDQFDPTQRDALLQEATKKVHRRLEQTRFRNAPTVGVSACVGGEKVAAEMDEISNPASAAATHKVRHETINMDLLVATFQQKLPIPTRSGTGDFYFAVDHCFPIKGRGTVLTGTCLSGSVSVNETVEFPLLQLDRKVKSMQMFKQNVTSISQGDRAGLCVSNLDSTLLERGIVAAPGAVQFWKGAIALVRKVPYYHGKLPQTSKFHISVGHTTIMAVATFWGAKELATTTGPKNAVVVGPIVPDAKGVAAIELQSSSLGGNAEMAGLPKLDFDFNQDFIQQQDGYQESVDGFVGNGLNWALLDFQTPVYCPRHSLVIGSRLDAVDNESGSSLSSSACRLAFSGRLIERIEPEQDGKRLRLYTPKEKIGKIARLGDPHTRSDDGKVVRYEVFGTDLFKKETNMKIFIGMKLQTKDGDIGEIKSSFGTSGEFRVWFPAGTAAQLADDLILRFKRFANDKAKAMHQDICLPPARSGARIEVVKKKNEVGVHRQGEIVALKGDLLENGRHTIIIVAGFFAPEINIKEKAGTAVLIPATNDEGKVLGPFGKAGKCKVSFQAGTSAQVGQKAKLMI